MNTWMQNHLPVIALNPHADIWAANAATDVYNLKLYGEITFLVAEGAGGTGTTTLTVEKCTSAAAAGATAIAFEYQLLTGSGESATSDTWGARTAATAAGYLTVGAASKMVAITVEAEDLGEDYDWVRLQTTEDDSTAVVGAIFAILGECRYAAAIMPTAIA